MAATIRTIFSQYDAPTTHDQWRKIADTFRSRYPQLADLLDAREEEVLAYLSFPSEHWRQIWSIDPL